MSFVWPDDFSAFSGIALLTVAPCVGSFIGTVIRRLPLGQNIVGGRSQCPACRRTLGARDLIPLVSWLVLRGRCRGCGQSIGAFHPAIELAAAMVALLALMSAPDATHAWLAASLGWTLLTLSWIDTEHFILPNSITLPLCLAGLGIAAFGGQPALLNSVIGSVLGFAAFWSIGRAYQAVRGICGLGEGDAKLMGAAGAWLGWQPLPIVVIIACFAGIAAALISRIAGREITRMTKVPFGPFLSLGFWLAYGPLSKWIGAI